MAWVKADGGDTEWKVAVPRTRVQEVLRLAHNHRTAGHLGAARTVARLRQAPVYTGER